MSTDVNSTIPDKHCLISVIIPVYNVAEYLSTCLESVCGQTYRNLEIILIDDGSTDESGLICDEWKERDPRMRVIHKKNGGVSSARNEGLLSACGDYIGFVDADDWLEPDMYERLLKEIEGADAVSCGYFDYPYGMGKPVVKGGKQLPICAFPEAMIAIMERDGYFTSVWNKLFRVSVLYDSEERILFDEGISFGEDEVWLTTVLRNCQKIAFLPKALYHWRPREGSSSRVQTVSQKELTLFTAKKKTMDLLPQRKYVIDLARSRLFNDCYLLKIRCYCDKKWEEYKIAETALKPFRMDWLRSKDPLFLRKVKVIVLEAEMGMKMPSIVVQITERIRRPLKRGAMGLWKISTYR